MDPNALREHLTTLHQELGAVREVDPRSSELLGEIMDDIKRLLERSAAAGSATPVPPPPAAAAATRAAGSRNGTSLADRLEQIAVQFEVDHPTLAASARRLVDLLGKVGL
jgi:enoyl-CoA hydratase/carnithine racemase